MRAAAVPSIPAAGLRRRAIAAGLAIAATAALPAGCSRPRRLSDLSRGFMAVGLPREVEVSVQVMVMMNEETMDHAPRCVRPAPRATATLNGVRLLRQTGVLLAPEFGYNRDCFIEFALSGRSFAELVRGGPSAILRIEDETASWVLEVPFAFAPRRLTLASPADGRLAPGQEVALSWWPPTDRFNPSSFALALRRQDGAGAPLYIRPPALRMGAGRLAFTVPADLPEELAGPIVIDAAFPGAIVPETRCPVATCEVSLWPSTIGAAATLTTAPGVR